MPTRYNTKPSNFARLHIRQGPAKLTGPLCTVVCTLNNFRKSDRAYLLDYTRLRTIHTNEAGDPMTAVEAAQMLKEWAIYEGLIRGERPDPDYVPPPEVLEFSDRTATILRPREVTFVGVNEHENQIIVFTRRAAPASKAQLEALPDELGGAQIVYRQGAAETIDINPVLPHTSPPYVVRTSVAGNGLYTCGSSISVGNFRDAGTFGAIVRDQAGDLFGLSNNHVTGSCSHSDVGLPILAPGVYDVAAGNIDPFTIGYHHASLQMVTGTPGNVPATANTDAALFRLRDNLAITSFQGNSYDTPTAISAPTSGMTVEKVGRTTGSTIGRVLCQVTGFQTITYNAPLYGFQGTVYYNCLYTVIGHGALFSDNGDSGSLVTTVDPATGMRKAVGLVVGGIQDNKAPGGKLTFILPIEPILTGFNVTLVGAHNV